MVPSSTKLRLEELLSEIEVTTNIMYNAIISENFDVFEQQLNERSQIVDKFFALKNDRLDSSELPLDISRRFNALYELDLKIYEEVEKFKSKLSGELKEIQKEKNQLLVNRKKTNQYTKGSYEFYRGKSFDIKK